MRIFTLLVLLGFTLVSQAQELTLLPKWKVGDKKTVITSKTSIDSEGGVEEIEASEETKSFVTVRSETKEHYVVDIKFQNESAAQVVALDDTKKEYDPELTYVNLNYHVSKTNGKARLQNWEDARDQIFGDFEALEKLYESDTATNDFVSIVKIAFAPIQMSLTSQEGVEGFFHEQIGFLTDHFGKELSVGKEIVEVEEEDNPFSKGEKISAKLITKLISLDKEGIAELSYAIDMDFSKFMIAMKDMMRKMMSGFGMEEAQLEEKLKELDNMKMDIENEQLITIDSNTGWVSSVDGNYSVLVEAEGKSRHTRANVKVKVD